MMLRGKNADNSSDGYAVALSVSFSNGKLSSGLTEEHAYIKAGKLYERNLVIFNN
jgi:hypothetical protein